MTTNRRAALRLARKRRRRAAAGVDHGPVTAVHAARRAIRPECRPPIVLRVAIPGDTSPDERAVLAEAACRVETIARVKFVVVEDLPVDLPFMVLLRPGRPWTRGRWPRAAVAFLDAVGDILAEVLDAAETGAARRA